jgi:DNA-binding NtrC family response regulator
VPRVLVVDENPMVCRTVEACLQRRGFEMKVADDGESGFGERNINAPAMPLIAISGYPPLDVTSCQHKALAPNRLPATFDQRLDQSGAVARPSNLRN